MGYHITLDFDSGTEGIIHVKDFEANVSIGGNAMGPYEFFLGGYASCLHATFRGVMHKRQIEYTKVEYDIQAFKREEVPTIINKMITKAVIYGVEVEKQKVVRKSMEQAKRYCSISEMIQRLEPEAIFEVEFK